MCLRSKRESLGTYQVKIQISGHQEIHYGGGYASLILVFSWLRKPVIVCYDRTDCGSLFHSLGEASAKPRIPITFLGQSEETGS